MLLKNRPRLTVTYWISTAVLFTFAGLLVAFYAPIEPTMGVIQKILYLHLPAAMITLLAAVLTFASSILYLVTHRNEWDDLANASARILILFCAVVLLTGMIWGRSAWGTWWTWSPRLTFTLLLFLLYLVYPVMRETIASEHRKATLCAMYGIIASLDVPLVYLSVNLMPDVHPNSSHLDMPMRLTLLAFLIPMFTLFVGMVMTRFSLNQQSRKSPQPKTPKHRNRIIGKPHSVGGLS